AELLGATGVDREDGPGRIDHEGHDRVVLEDRPPLLLAVPQLVLVERSLDRDARRMRDDVTFRADARASCIPFVGGGVTRCCHVAPPGSRAATRSGQQPCRTGGREVGGSKSAFYLDGRITAVSEGNISAASVNRTPTEIRPVRREGRLAVGLSGLAK